MKTCYWLDYVCIITSYLIVVNNFLKFSWKNFLNENLLLFCWYIDNSIAINSCQQLFFDIFKKIFYPILSYKCSIIFCSNNPVFKTQTSVMFSVIWENTDFFWLGGTKNYYTRLIFSETYKLVHLHTNLKIKPLTQNH